jgi:hypothetical protein
MKKLYKIRREDELFSMGGLDPSFRKTGKVWKSIGNLKNHINLVLEYNPDAYDYCEVVEYEIKEIGSYSAPKWIKSYLKERMKREQSGMHL